MKGKLFNFMLSELGGYLFVLAVFIVTFISVCKISSDNKYEKSNEIHYDLPVAVEAYRNMVSKTADRFGVNNYTNLFLAIIVAESMGQGTDPMQSSQSKYNTEFPKVQSGITDSQYSIECGIQYMIDCIRLAQVKDENDLPRIKTALQGYNFGEGYIIEANEKAGGNWKQSHVLDFARRYSNNMKRTAGTILYERAGIWDYGDQYYPEHVLPYYKTDDNSMLVNIALSQVGNVGGEEYWRWYGFASKVDWCACFISWCLDKCGCIEKETAPKFSVCSDGMYWFKNKNLWKNPNTTPKAGYIIFFDWDNCGEPQHVGIVEKVDDNTVYTIEGNSGDTCKQMRYLLTDTSILGYGIIK